MVDDCSECLALGAELCPGCTDELLRLADELPLGLSPAEVPWPRPGQRPPGAWRPSWAL